MAKMPKPEEMIASRASFPEKSWMDKVKVLVVDACR